MLGKDVVRAEGLVLQRDLTSLKYNYLFARSLVLVVWKACRQLFISNNGSLVVTGFDVCHGISSVSCVVMCIQSLLDRKRRGKYFYEKSV